MVTTPTNIIAPTTTTTNNGNMLLYNSNNNNNSNNVETTVISEGVNGGGMTTCNTVATLEQYRLQLYNYALNMERLRGPPYTAAAAMAAAAAYASTTTVSTTTVNGPAVHGSNYSATGQGPPPQAPSSYLCATSAGSLIAATTQMGRSPASLAQCPAGNRLALASMSLFPQRIFQPEEPKPQHSYIGLIAMAILSSAETKLVLSDIYQYILDNYPYFRTRGPGWRNSIRHNLSLNDCFIKSGRSANGKGHYWAIHPANMEDFRKGDFRRRKAQRKVRKHMGLAVDDNGTDSPSPPPAMDLTSPSPPSFQHIVMSGNTITPLATAAQHLAAQSFGWRFTQHHHRHHPQHSPAGAHATNGTAASYMGQIFTYRPHHYAAAAVAAAALCHSGNSQQHHQLQQQQQLIAPTSHPALHTSDTSYQQQKPLLPSQSSSLTTTNAQANVINEIFSQKRKRQFDVASLLAPDNLHKREFHQHQQQGLRKHTCENEADEIRPPASFNDEILESNEPTNDLDIEDIDVVEASEDEDIEADYEDHDDEIDSNSNSQSHNGCHSHNDDDENENENENENEYERRLNAEQVLRLKTNDRNASEINVTQEDAVIRVHDYGPDEEVDEEPHEAEGDDEHENTNEANQSEFSTATPSNNNNIHPHETHLSRDYKNITSLLKASSSPLQHTTSLNSPPPSIHHLPTSQQLLEHTTEIQRSLPPTHHQLPINSEAHNLFGRYYGSYMAAAAAARINCSMPTVNTVVGNTD